LSHFGVHGERGWLSASSAAWPASGAVLDPRVAQVDSADIGGSAVTCYRDVTATLITSDQAWVKEEHDWDEVVLGVPLDCGLPENRWHG
jgi:hypothetical protein